MNKRSDLYRRILKGERLDDVLIIDNHGHLGIGLFNSLPLDREVAGTVAVMDTIGVDRGVVFYCGHDYHRGNQITLESVAMAPQRLIPYAYLNTDTPPTLLEELERCRQAGMVGLKLHSGWSGAKFTDATWKDVWAYCAQHHWPVIIHGMEPCLARENPQTIFIHAHGIECTFRDEVIQTMRECPNYYLDTSATMTAMGAIERVVALVGADRLLLGSDFPGNNMATRLGAVLAARISDEDMRKILGGNIARLLDLKLRNAFPK
ncbi:MAG: amidohydrolase family protein [Kiritimatiellia bacterium]|nr:amidohydrolase family protein [Kiritimatiellia bacterium]